MFSFKHTREMSSLNKLTDQTVPLRLGKKFGNNIAHIKKSNNFFVRFLINGEVRTFMYMNVVYIY